MTGWLADLVIRLYAEREDCKHVAFKEMVKCLQHVDSFRIQNKHLGHRLFRGSFKFIRLSILFTIRILICVISDPRYWLNQFFQRMEEYGRFLGPAEKAGLSEAAVSRQDKDIDDLNCRFVFDHGAIALNISGLYGHGVCEPCKHGCSAVSAALATQAEIACSLFQYAEDTVRFTPFVSVSLSVCVCVCVFLFCVCMHAHAAQAFQEAVHMAIMDGSSGCII